MSSTPQRDEVLIDGRDGGQIIRLAGVSFRPDYPDNLIELDTINKNSEEPVALDLVREPDNAYDSNAIMVLYEGQHLGYIPKALNEGMAALMDRGEVLLAHVDEVRIHPKDPNKPGLIIHVIPASRIILPAPKEAERGIVHTSGGAWKPVPGGYMEASRGEEQNRTPPKKKMRLKR